MKLAGYSLVLVLMVDSALAADLQGADAYLDYLSQGSSPKAETTLTRKQLRGAISAYPRDRSSLSPAESAQREVMPRMEDREGRSPGSIIGARWAD
ncbi:MAG: hypothetical protein QM796_06700 [Chthoniobacteraceae bacterium]